MPLTVRRFLLHAALLWLACGVGLSAAPNRAFGQTEAFQYASQYYTAEVSLRQPAFRALVIDGLGQGEFADNPLWIQPEIGKTYTAEHDTDSVAYYRVQAAADDPPSWTIRFAADSIELVSQWSPAGAPDSLLIAFDAYMSPVTLLGLFDDQGRVRLPALIHYPGQGSWRVTASDNPQVALGYFSRRRPHSRVKVSFPAATAEQPLLRYRLEATAVYPEVSASLDGVLLDGYKRSWLNILQLNPHLRCLANNASSDACAFTLYTYSEIARLTPPLADGLSALDLLRATLDRYCDGMPGYGMVGYIDFDHPDLPPLGPYDFLDTYPSLLIAAWNYVRSSGDDAWLRDNYATLLGWSDKLLASDRDGNGLIEYPVSGNSGIWAEQPNLRPANWWDCIGFGHEDAYSNALAYRALRGLVELAGRIGHDADARRFETAAARLHGAYLPTFFNPETGILAGWRSTDGRLHDYWFTFVNGLAVTCGLVPRPEADHIMDRLLAKFRDVGYDRFEFGLPGNLVPVARADYVSRDLRFGAGQRADNADGFQIYENGGASACFAYYTVQALYDLGRHAEADTLLFGMLDGIRQRGFQGPGPKNRTYDWKSWDGSPQGYEGFLVDNYLVLLAVVTRPDRP